MKYHIQMGSNQSQNTSSKLYEIQNKTRMSIDGFGQVLATIEPKREFAVAIGKPYIHYKTDRFVGFDPEYEIKIISVMVRKQRPQTPEPGESRTIEIRGLEGR